MTNVRFSMRFLRALAGVTLAFLAGISLSQDSLTDDQKDLVGIAKTAIRAEIEGNSCPSVEGSRPVKPVFVTIEKGIVVRGCRGSLEARSGSLEEAVQLAARSAAKHDPRYRPLEKADLDSIRVTVTIVERLEPIASVDGLVPSDGLVLISGDRKGIVLPYEGRDPHSRLKWAYKKAGVPEGSPVRLERLIGTRFAG